MKVRQLMSAPVLTIAPDETLAKATELLRIHRVSRLVVASEERIIGIITEKDIARAFVRSGGKISPVLDQQISDIMTRNPLTVDPEVTAKRAAEIMLERNISGLPVAEEFALKGIITKLDYAKVCREYADVYVGEVMEAGPPFVAPNTKIKRVWKLLDEENLVVVPVVDQDQVVGTVGAREIALLLPPKISEAAYGELATGHIMNREVSTIRSDSEVSKAAELMLLSRLSGLPVLDSQNRLVGLFTKTELVEVAHERL